MSDRAGKKKSLDRSKVSPPLAITDDESEANPATMSELLIEEAIKQTDLLARINEKLRHRQRDVWAQRIFWLLLNALVVIPIVLALIYYSTRNMP